MTAPVHPRKRYPVRLAATGAHLFDGDYPFGPKEVVINDIVVTFMKGSVGHKGHWIAGRDLTHNERLWFAEQVQRANEKQLREWEEMDR